MRHEKLYLTDILEAADAIERFIAGLSKAEFINDELYQSAVLQKLIVIGEAAAKLPKKFQVEHDEINWPDIIGFRNIAVHEYFAVSWSIVWITATQDVPGLRVKIAQILAEEFPS